MKSVIRKIKARPGFTLVETMIVIAILIVLLSVAIPQILRSRVISNEAAAIANIKTLSNACQAFSIDNKSYPSQLKDLAEVNPAYIDSSFASGSKQGYKFTYSLVNPDHFTISAESENKGLLKGRYFYTDESGVIRFSTKQDAGPEDEMVK